MVWTLLEHILKEERSLFIDRHLDQNLLCIVYVVCKANKADTSFVDIMSHYRNQPQSRSHIYRMVRVDSSMVEKFMRMLTESSSRASLTPMPVRRIPRGTPLKRSLSDKVTIVPYGQVPYIHRDVTSVRYKLTQSPTRDFRAINRLLNRNRPLYRIAGAPEKAAPHGYRIVLALVKKSDHLVGGLPGVRLMSRGIQKKSENKRAKQLADQAQARRDKNKEARKRREERQHANRTDLLRKISESERTAVAAKQK
nr:Retinoblastoma-associated protein domain containing protein [Haemonchus contortus]